MKRIIVVSLALVLSIAGYAVPAQAALCAEASEYNFLSVYWTGHPAWSFDYARFDFTGTSRTGTSFIYPDERTGYIEIATQDGCSWTVTVTQAVQAYVAV